MGIDPHEAGWKPMEGSRKSVQQIVCLARALSGCSMLLVCKRMRKAEDVFGRAGG